jgi:hypothetical protein
VVAVVAVPVAATLAQPYSSPATRFALGVSVGLLFAGFAGASHVLHAVLSGPDWTDVTGIGAAIGGLLLVVGGAAALATVRSRPRVIHAVLWLAGAFLTLSFVLMPLALALFTGHSPRNPVSEASLGIPHQEVRVPTEDGRRLSAWYVPSRNGAAVVLIHGSSGNRARVADRTRLLARHGYGVLALDLFGAGESEGHSSGLGDNSQPAVDAALDYLAHRPDVDPAKIAGFGVSLGGEVMLEGAAYDQRLRAVISDGAARPQDSDRVESPPLSSRIAFAFIRGISGMRPAPSLIGLMPEIAPRPVLLIGTGSRGTEIPVTRLYADAAGSNAQVWEIPEAGHTGGLRARPVEYERRVIDFLDGALDLGGLRGSGRDL